MFLPGESPRSRSLAGYTVHGVAKSRTHLKSPLWKAESTISTWKKNLDKGSRDQTLTWNLTYPNLRISPEGQSLENSASQAPALRSSRLLSHFPHPLSYSNFSLRFPLPPAPGSHLLPLGPGAPAWPPLASPPPAQTPRSSLLLPGFSVPTLPPPPILGKATCPPG